MRTVALVGGRDLEGLAGVDGEADLAGAAPVVADARQAVTYSVNRVFGPVMTCSVLVENIPEVLRAARCPRRDGGALRCAQEVEVASTWERRLATAAVEGILEVGVDGVGAVRVVGGAKGRGVVELHVGQHCS